MTSLVGIELVRESHDSFLIARGSDALAVLATCGMASQLCAVGIGAVLFGLTAGLRDFNRYARSSAALLGAIILALAGTSIAIDGKEGLVTENIGAFRVREFPLQGEAPLLCRRGLVTMSVSQESRTAVLFRGLPPWRVDVEPLFRESTCREWVQ